MTYSEALLVLARFEVSLDQVMAMSWAEAIRYALCLLAAE